MKNTPYTEDNLNALYAALGSAGAIVRTYPFGNSITISDGIWPRSCYNVSFPTGKEQLMFTSLEEELMKADSPSVVLCRTDASTATLELLRTHALAERSWAAMALDLTSFAPPEQQLPEDFRIVRLTETTRIGEWCRVLEQSLMGGLPVSRFLFERLAADDRFCLLLATLQGEAVACCLVYFHQDAAGIYLVGTLPERQGTGFGTAIMVHALQYARERGAAGVFLQATPAGEPVYTKLGFRKTGAHAVFRLK